MSESWLMIEAVWNAHGHNCFLYESCGAVVDIVQMKEGAYYIDMMKSNSCRVF